MGAVQQSGTVSNEINAGIGVIMSEKQFVDGLLVKAPHEKAPEFVKCSISIKRKDLGNWLRAQTEEWINLDVKVAKSGKWYAEVNTWKKEDKKPEPKAPANDLNDEIPFN